MKTKRNGIITKRQKKYLYRARKILLNFSKKQRKNLLLTLHPVMGRTIPHFRMKNSSGIIWSGTENIISKVYLMANGRLMKVQSKILPHVMTGTLPVRSFRMISFSITSYIYTLRRRWILRID